MRLLERLNAVALQAAKGQRSRVARSLVRVLRKPYELALRTFASNGIEMVMPDGKDTLFLHPDLYHWDFSGNEPKLYALLKSNLRQGGTFLDVGAYIGHYSVTAAQIVGPGGTVFAFEPSDKAYEYLLYHLKANAVSDRVHPMQILVGDSDREAADFFVLSDSLEASNSVAVHPDVTAVRGKPPVRTTRPMRSIDSLVEEFGLTPDVIKIDVEGAEVRSLEGASETLRKNQPLVFCAIHPDWLGATGDSIEGLQDLADRISYEILDLDYKAKSSFALEEVIMRHRK